jgi:hypothetical protein
MNPENRPFRRHREEQVSLAGARARASRAVFLSVCNGHS